MLKGNRLYIATALFLTVGSGVAFAGDWPTYHADAARTGYTSEALPANLAPLWTYKGAHPPRPAWPDEPSMLFDPGYAPVSDGHSLYFGSSADCKIYALDAATGKERWTFFTVGPVRFAPALWKDCVFAVSDDGQLYCLSAKDGKLLWKKRGGPGSGRMVLGNERMISKWPARGGPVVVDDIVYFGAGIWPADGVYIYALEAESGKEVWVNDQSGYIKIGQPHRGGVRGNAAVSSQGHLVVAGDKLIVPVGRSAPAVFNRADGKLLYFHIGARSGSLVAVVDSMFLTGENAFQVAGGHRLGSMPTRGRTLPRRL